MTKAELVEMIRTSFIGLRAKCDLREYFPDQPDIAIEKFNYHTEELATSILDRFKPDYEWNGLGTKYFWEWLDGFELADDKEWNIQIREVK